MSRDDENPTEHRDAESPTESPAESSAESPAESPEEQGAPQAASFRSYFELLEAKYGDESADSEASGSREEAPEASDIETPEDSASEVDSQRKDAKSRPQPDERRRKREVSPGGGRRKEGRQWLVTFVVLAVFAAIFIALPTWVAEDWWPNESTEEAATSDPAATQPPAAAETGSGAEGASPGARAEPSGDGPSSGGVAQAPEPSRPGASDRPAAAGGGADATDSGGADADATGPEADASDVVPPAPPVLDAAVEDPLGTLGPDPDRPDTSGASDSDDSGAGGSDSESSRSDSDDLQASGSAGTESPSGSLRESPSDSPSAGSDDSGTAAGTPVDRAEADAPAASPSGRDQGAQGGGDPGRVQPPATAGESEEVRIGPLVRARKVFAPQPAYPPAARQRREAGTVTVVGTVTSGGDVRDARVVDGVSPALDRAALEAFSTWQFIPAKRGEQPIESPYRVSFNFQIDDPLESRAEQSSADEADDDQSSESEAAEAQAELDPSAPRPFGGDFTPPSRWVTPLPSYPQEERASGLSGDVVLAVIVEADGLVSEVEVMRGLSEIIDRTALDAVRQWRFRPATRDGQPLRVEHRVTLRFVP